MTEYTPPTDWDESFQGILDYFDNWYGFEDKMGHPISNCIDFRSLMVELIGLRESVIKGRSTTS